MASVSEQIASRINLGSIAKAEDLKKKNYIYSSWSNCIQNRFIHPFAWNRSGSIREGL
jgi:hypothetical protein